MLLAEGRLLIKN